MKTKSFNLGISGIRQYNNYLEFCRLLDKYISTKIPDDMPINFITGDAPGIDDMVEDYVGDRTTDVRPYTLKKHVADWETYGNSAGMLRNGDIVYDADQLLAFWDGSSRGTADAIDKCTKAAKIVDIIKIEPTEYRYYCRRRRMEFNRGNSDE